MTISARNRVSGKVVSLTLGNVMAEVIVEAANGHRIVAAITRRSVYEMGIKEGDEVTAVIKSTDVMIEK